MYVDQRVTSVGQKDMFVVQGMMVLAQRMKNIIQILTCRSEGSICSLEAYSSKGDIWAQGIQLVAQ
jgi:hypothetical protein